MFTAINTTLAQGTYIPPDLNEGDIPSQTYTFYENKGQLIDDIGNLRPDLKYYTNTGLFLTDEKVSLTWTQMEDSLDNDSTFRIDMSRYNSSTFTSPIPIEKSNDYLNYFLSHCPKGVTNVKGYQRIVYPNYFENIDYHLYSNQAGLKQFFVAHPGSNPSGIELKFEGQDQLVSNLQGLELYLDGETIIIPDATAYEVDNFGQVFPLSWQPNFILSSSDRIKFQIGNYNSQNTLVILISDPNYSMTNASDDWITYHGGTNMDQGFSITTDNTDNVYVTGTTSSLQFPNTTGSTIQPNCGCFQDAFVSKFNTNAVHQWSTYYGGTARDDSRDIAVNTFGDVYVVGETFSSNFPNTSGTLDGSSDAFVIKLNNAGTSTIFADFFGGNVRDIALSVDVNNNNHAFVVGHTNSFNSFPTVPKTSAYNQTTNKGGIDGFIIELDNSDSQVWGTYFGGFSADRFGSIKIDPLTGHLFLIGDTNTDVAASANTNNTPCGVPTTNDFPDCDPGGNTYHQTWGGGDPIFVKDAIVVEFNDAGQLVWSTYLGGDGTEQVVPTSLGFSFGNFPSCGIDINQSHLAVMGWSGNHNSFPHTATSTEYNQSSGSGPFIVRFINRDFSWSSAYGCETTASSTFTKGCVIDENGNIYITGDTNCDDYVMPSDYCSTPPIGEFPICRQSSNTFFQEDSNGDPLLAGSGESYIAAFNVQNQLIWSTYFGRGSNDRADGIAYNKTNRRLYLTGLTRSSNFPILDPGTPNAFVVSSKPSATLNDSFIARFNISDLVTSTNHLIPHSLNMNIYPNPTHEILNIEIDESFQISDLRILSIDGKKLYEENSSFSFYSIDIGSLSSGVYIVQVITQEGVFNKKFIKQ